MTTTFSNQVEERHSIMCMKMSVVSCSWTSLCPEVSGANHSFGPRHVSAGSHTHFPFLVFSTVQWSLVLSLPFLL